MHTSLAVIHDEHRSVAAVLHGLRHLAKLASEATVRPDFRVFAAMIYYIDAFPEKQHHPKEDAFLFAALARRKPEAAALVDALRDEHVQSLARVRELEQALLRYEASWPEGGQAFVEVLERYCEFQWAHMRKEEQDLIPQAEDCLTAEDWAEVDGAFAANADPLSGARAAQEDFPRMFSRIVNLAPAPIGLGKAWTT